MTPWSRRGTFPRHTKRALASSWGATAIVILLFPLFTGCWVQSVYPFYEDSDVIVDNSLVGEWIGAGELKDCVLTISLKAGAKAYTIRTSGAASGSEAHVQCDSGALAGKLVQLGQQRFIDMVPDDDSAWAPLDTILKLETSKEGLALTPLDAEWTAEAITEKTVKLQGRFQEEEHGGAFSLAFERVYLVSPTSELREFLRQHADDKRAFSESGRMDFRRKGNKL